MALTLRLQKGSKLTFGEADENFKYLETLGFQGALKKTDEPELAGFYLPQESGTYPNAGGLSADYAGVDAGKLVLFTFDRTEWKKIEVSIGAGGGGSSYVLPTASASVLGGVKVGANLAIDPLTGEMSAVGNTLPLFSDSKPGGYSIDTQIRGPMGNSFVSLINGNTAPLTDKTKWMESSNTVLSNQMTFELTSKY